MNCLYGVFVNKHFFCNDFSKLLGRSLRNLQEGSLGQKPQAFFSIWDSPPGGHNGAKLSNLVMI